MSPQRRRQNALDARTNQKIDVRGFDIDERSIDLCKKHAKKAGVFCDWRVQDIKNFNVTEKSGIIVCNPPYLTMDDMQSLQQELTFEPKLALYGGGDGLDYYRKIAWEYRDHLNANGVLLLEIGNTQAKTASALFDANTRVLNDLSGNPRVLVVEP